MKNIYNWRNILTGKKRKEKYTLKAYLHASIVTFFPFSLTFSRLDVLKTFSPHVQVLSTARIVLPPTKRRGTNNGQGDSLIT